MARTRFPASAAAGLVVALALIARAGDPIELNKDDAERLKPYLERGALLVVEPKPEGGVGATTAIISIAAPLETAFSTVLDFDSYPKWVPRVVRATVEKKDESTFDVTHELDVPGRNLTYTIRFSVDRAKHVIDGRWLKGDLGAGRWTWRFTSSGTGTVVSYAQEGGDYASQSRLLSLVDDSRKTMSSGLGLATGYLMVRAAKVEIERRAPPKESGRDWK